MKIFSIFWSLIVALFFASQLFASPVVTNINPALGPTSGGTTVTITGSGFTGTTAVNFGTTPATSFLVMTDMLMTAVSPAHVPEVVSIAVTTGSGTSPPSSASLYVYQGNGLAFVANNNADTVSVINTSSDMVTAILTVGANPRALAITPDGSKVYVANNGGNSVSVINTVNNAVGTIPVDNFPYAIGIIPSGTKAYVVNNNSNEVQVINTTTDTVIATIPVQNNPNAIAITPDGTKAYVSNSGSMSVSVIDTATDTVVATISVGIFPCAIAITPDGTKAFVANNNSGTVSVITIASDMVSNTIAVGSNPCAIAITPSQNKAYVANRNSQNVSVINIATNMVIATIPVAVFPDAIVITPDGTKAYVVDNNSGEVSVISTASDTVSTTLVVGNNPCAIAMTPDGSKAYVTNNTSGNVSVIQIATNVVTAATTGNFSEAIAITPDQAPLAKFTFNSPNSPITFDASASASPIGTIVNYFWDFGDGNAINTASPVTVHFYAASGTYTVSLTVTNSAGTSTTQLYRPTSSNDLSFNGATLTSNGGATAITSQMINANVTLLPPINLQATSSKNRFLTQTDHINILTWDAPIGGIPPSAYKIYRNSALTKLAGVVSANGKLEFIDHNRKRNYIYTYYVVSVDSFGNQSVPAIVTIRN